MTKPSCLSSRLVKWALLLTQYDIEYKPQKSIKGQALADFLVAYPLPADLPLAIPFPDETVLHAEEVEGWKMFFDGASSTNDKGERTLGVGILLIFPAGYLIPHAYALAEPCSNNRAVISRLTIHPY